MRLCVNQTPWVLMALLFGLLAAADVAAEDRPVSSIPEFVAAKDRWDRLVGRPMRLEGRYTAFSPTEIRFKNCDLRFVLAREFRRPQGESPNIEVAGQLVRKTGGLEFRVTELRPRESDKQLLKLKRALLDNANSEAVFELAEWARHRAEFYDDDELLQEADRLNREGLAIASDHLRPDDEDGLRDLAKKAREVGVDEGYALRYLHRANRLAWEQAQSAEKKNYRDVLRRIGRELPGASQPLPIDRLAIRDDYRAAPLAVYRVADSATRRLLDRAFYLEVALADILLSAEENGKNGYEIADRIEQALPELAGLAEEFRQRELTYLTERVGRLSRAQMLSLSERYEDRGDADQARAIVGDWLRVQEMQAAQSGPTELMDLGDEYVNLLGDERSAARLYQLAYEKNPQLKTARDWLTAHGYELTGEQWSNPGEHGASGDESPMDEAIQEGRVQVGMTGQQVLRTLGTQPSSTIRIASSGEISELWVFRDSGITVRLERSQTNSQARVVDIGTVD